ncbi:transcriptional regulatory protein [Parvularcula bermudensis HTCC2503]|uniref:Transcriptional regulatory protein n=2 Tax=Parvularcula TaxID=208215 RepID=E0TCA3_PARBH|nr:transcriptional regulatory protein [Parvularcula bermudensis HTCC2503]
MGVSAADRRPIGVATSLKIARSVERPLLSPPIQALTTNKDFLVSTKQSADLARYHTRMQRVFAHIDDNIDGDLGLEALSSVAAFSPCHFHRQFRAIFGVSLHRYVQLVRMKRASWRLAYRADVSVTEIALDAGYEAPDSFARAFRQLMGQAPKAFREEPNWSAWAAAMVPLAEARNQIMMQNFSINDIEIRQVGETSVAFMSHRGEPERLGQTIRKFIAWRKANGVRAGTHATYTIFHTDPDSVASEDYRIDLAAATDRATTCADEDIESGLIPAGRCAVLRIIGQSDNLRHAAEFLYRQWLPASGEELREFPLYAQRVSFFPDVPEHEAITDLFLPLK